MNQAKITSSKMQLLHTCCFQCKVVCRDHTLNPQFCFLSILNRNSEFTQIGISVSEFPPHIIILL